MGGERFSQWKNCGPLGEMIGAKLLQQQQNYYREYVTEDWNMVSCPW